MVIDVGFLTLQSGRETPTKSSENCLCRTLSLSLFLRLQCQQSLSSKSRNLSSRVREYVQKSNDCNNLKWGEDVGGLGSNQTPKFRNLGNFLVAVSRSLVLVIAIVKTVKLEFVGSVLHPKNPPLLLSKNSRSSYESLTL